MDELQIKDTTDTFQQHANIDTLPKQVAKVIVKWIEHWEKGAGREGLREKGRR